MRQAAFVVFSAQQPFKKLLTTIAAPAGPPGSALAIIAAVRRLPAVAPAMRFRREIGFMAFPREFCLANVPCLAVTMRSHVRILRFAASVYVPAGFAAIAMLSAFLPQPSDLNNIETAHSASVGGNLQAITARRRKRNSLVISNYKPEAERALRNGPEQREAERQFSQRR